MSLAPDLFGYTAPSPNAPAKAKPAFAATPLPADRAPRIIPIAGGGKAFLHPCSVCGSAGSFGEGVALRRGQPGTWFCGEHLPAGYRAVLGHLSETTP